MFHKNFIVPVTLVMLLSPMVGMGADKLKKATFRPQWVPQAQFAGYYTAVAKGFYKNHGIDLEIIAGGPGIVPSQNLAKKKETFGTDLLIGAMSLAAKGAPVINIGQIFQTTALSLITKKSTNINSPQEMDKKKVGVWPGLFQVPPIVLFRRLKIAPVTQIQKFSMDEFIEGKVDVASAMTYNEYLVALQSVPEKDLKVFHFKDFNLNFPDDGIYAHKDTCDADPKLCSGFVKASVEGWKYAFAHPSEAIDAVMDAATKAKTNTTRAHQEKMLAEVQKLVAYRTGIDKIGGLDKKDFKFVREILKEQGEWKTDVSYENFYRNVQ